MSQAPPASTSEGEAKDAIYNRLELTDVLAAATAAHGWTEEEAKGAQDRYRDFLWMCWNSMSGNLPRLRAMSQTADDVWHYHLLDTQKYLKDCVTIYGPGEPLHHVPDYQTKPKAAVQDQEISRAADAYRKLGLKVPGDLVYECAW